MNALLKPLTQTGKTAPRRFDSAMRDRLQAVYGLAVEASTALSTTDGDADATGRRKQSKATSWEDTLQDAMRNTRNAFLSMAMDTHDEALQAQIAALKSQLAKEQQAADSLRRARAEAIKQAEELAAQLRLMPSAR